MITVYSTPTCGYCHMAKEYFKMKGLEFKAKDITMDTDAFEEYQEISGQRGVPVIDIDGKVVVGFDRNTIDLLLREKGLV